MTKSIQELGTSIIMKNGEETEMDVHQQQQMERICR